jgi:2-polyprenyl-6-methoxyphenol hydroxylase-like FAD-dependent oxidoreductase
VSKHVLIVGAGPVGLVTALRLASFGIRSTVFEKSDDIPRDLRATTFHPPTLDMLDELGVADEFISLGITTPRWQVLHLASGEKAVFDIGAIADVTRHPYRLQCEQYRLVEILFARARNSDLIDIRLGSEVVSVSQDGASAAAVVHTAQGDTRISGDYLVGADGAHSVVRQTLGLELQGETYPSLTVLITTPFPFHDHMPALIGANYIWGPQDSFSMFRLRTEWRVTFYPRPGETEEHLLTDDALQERLNGVLPSATPYELWERRGYRIHQRIVPNYRTGRIVLAGDAAHLNAPTGGMGMNGGVHDAFNLSDKLRQILAGAGDELLDVYTAERRPVAHEEIIAQAHQNRTRMQESDPDRQMASLRALQAIAADQAKLRTYVLKASMFEGLRRSNMVRFAA